MIPCQYGAACFRRNPKHLAQFSHPARAELVPDGPNAPAVALEDDSKQQSKRKRPLSASSSTETVESVLYAEPPSKKPRLDMDDGLSSASLTVPGSPAASPPATHAAHATHATYAAAHAHAAHAHAHAAPVLAAPALAAPQAAATSLSDFLARMSDEDDEHATQLSAAVSFVTQRRTDDALAVVESAFGLAFDDDLSAIWRLANALRPDSPRHAFVGSLGLVLVGPFCVLDSMRRGDAAPPANVALAWRLYFDPPELVTCLVDCDEAQAAGLHFGLYRDYPTEPPLFVASAKLQPQAKLVPVAATLSELLWRRCVCENGVNSGALYERLCDLVPESRRTTRLAPIASARARVQLGPTLTGLGVVGDAAHYRDCYLSQAELVRILDNIASLQLTGVACDSATLASDEAELADLLTCVDLANDEGDSAMALQVGLSLFAHSTAFAAQAARIMRTAYRLLGRHAFAVTIEAHAAVRFSCMPDLSLPAADQRPSVV